LENVAKFREGRLPAKYFAAAIGDHALFNFEPVYSWEKVKPGNFTRALLARAGIDHETVDSEGLARAIMQAVGRRRYQGLAEIRALGPAAELQVANLWKLTTKEARAHLLRKLDVAR
jgi:hypothetical protein